EEGTRPTGTSGAAAKPPRPLPRRILTLLLPELATAKSSLPSPLKSPTATDWGKEPTGKGPTGVKLGTIRASSASTLGRNPRRAARRRAAPTRIRSENMASSLLVGGRKPVAPLAGPPPPPQWREGALLLQTIPTRGGQGSERRVE